MMSVCKFLSALYMRLCLNTNSNNRGPRAPSLGASVEAPATGHAALQN